VNYLSLKVGGLLAPTRILSYWHHLTLSPPALRHTLHPSFNQDVDGLESRLDTLIAPQRRLSYRAIKCFANRLRKHRAHLLCFLYVDDLEAINKLVERMLRLAVITRRISGCSFPCLLDLSLNAKQVH
jgi:hypothetical protein